MKPKAYVFAGPTLAQADLVQSEGIAFLGPAAQGDVYRAARTMPKAIGIIDGYFEGQASVWHKEILWAIDQGIHVFGSASMGALRAAELHPFGMIGVGKIFEAYRDGVLEDDDEVAVLHAPADAGFLTLSEPMVNIRATLEEAKRQGVVDAETSDDLERLAKETFYQERCWSGLMAHAEQEGIAADIISAFKSWLPGHRADQKEIDARLMIKAVAACLDQDEAPLPADYYFEWTEMWEAVVNKADARQRDSLGGDGDATGEAILDEFRLEAGALDPRYRLALLRALVNGDNSPAPSRQRISQAITAFREARGLFSRADLDRWLQHHHLEARDFERLMAEDVAIDECLIDLQAEIGRHLLDHLRLDDRYRPLAERAAAKQAFLDKMGQAEPDVAGFPLSPPELRAWYFEQRRGEPMPDDLDRYARRIGFEDRQRFDQALRREYLYVTSRER